MPNLSQSPDLYLKVSGLEQDPYEQGARFSPGDMLVNNMPADLAPPSVPVLQRYEGDPQPNRGVAVDWPILKEGES